MFVVYELEVREGEFLLYHPGEFGLDGFCPLTDKDNELVDGPSYTAPGNLGVISLELCFFACSLGAEIFLCPNVTMQLRIVDERQAIVSSFLHLLWGDFLLSDTEETLVLRVVPEDADLWHWFIKGAHCVHLLL